MFFLIFNYLTEKHAINRKFAPRVPCAEILVFLRGKNLTTKPTKKFTQSAQTKKSIL
jgi:hypothetical protein